MRAVATPEEIHELVNGLNFKEKVERSLDLINEAYEEFGDGLVVANSLGKDSVRRLGPGQARQPGHPRLHRHHALQAGRDEAVHGRARGPVPGDCASSSNDVEIPDELYETDPDRCCDLLKVAADAPGDRGDGRHLLGHRPALHRGAHAHRLSTRSRSATRACSSSTRSSSGTSARSGSTSPSTRCRSTRSTPRATARSAARPARTSPRRSTSATAAGSAPASAAASAASTPGR